MRNANSRVGWGQVGVLWASLESKGSQGGFGHDEKQAVLRRKDSYKIQDPGRALGLLAEA